MKGWLLVLAFSLAPGISLGSEALTDEPKGNAYHFVSHYSIEIDAPASVVWRHLIELGSWMYEFKMQPVTNIGGLEGRVFRLYEGQDFYVQVTKALPGKLLVLANMPSTMEGEELTSGVSVTTLTENAGKTTVQLTMSRRYVWKEVGDNHLKARRQSDAFNSNTRDMWSRFLQKLSELATS